MAKRMMLAVAWIAWIACSIPVGYAVSHYGWVVVIAIIFGVWWGAMAFDGLLDTFARKA